MKSDIVDSQIFSPGLSWGGNSEGSRYFNVITADEKTCVDHKIPQLGQRYVQAAVI